MMSEINIIVEIGVSLKNEDPFDFEALRQQIPNYFSLDDSASPIPMEADLLTEEAKSKKYTHTVLFFGTVQERDLKKLENESQKKNDILGIWDSPSVRLP